MYFSFLKVAKSSTFDDTGYFTYFTFIRVKNLDLFHLVISKPIILDNVFITGSCPAHRQNNFRHSKEHHSIGNYDEVSCTSRVVHKNQAVLVPS